MSDTTYEGLSLPELFELLHDVVPPEPVAMTPQTPGWWVLLAWAMLVGLLATWRARRRWVANRYRREALVMLQNVADDDLHGAAAIAGIVKRTALAAYPRSQVANLWGQDWAGFLVDSSGNDALVAGGAERLAEASWREGIRVAEVSDTAQRWIRVHRA